MANKITRTIKVTEADALCVDTVSGQAFNKVIELAGTYKDYDAMLKAAKKANHEQNIVLVKVNSAIIKSTRYAISESVFLANAERLPDESEG